MRRRIWLLRGRLNGGVGVGMMLLLTMLGLMT